MIKLNIKPLSVNDAWQGRRFKTPEYKKYINDLMMILPALKVPEGELHLLIEWGFSSKASDNDNPLKCFQDCLQLKYKFNDSRIYETNLKKKIVKKGQEYIKFEIKQLTIGEIEL